MVQIHEVNYAQLIGVGLTYTNSMVGNLLSNLNIIRRFLALYVLLCEHDQVCHVSVASLTVPPHDIVILHA